MLYIKKIALIWVLGLLANAQLYAAADFLIIAQELIKISDEIRNVCLKEIENKARSYTVNSTDEKTINDIFNAIKKKYCELMPQFTEILNQLPIGQKNYVIKRLARAQKEALKDNSFYTVATTIKAMKNFFANMHLALFNTYKNEYFNRMYMAEMAETLCQNTKLSSYL